MDIKNFFQGRYAKLGLQAAAAVALVELFAGYFGTDKIYWAEISAILVICSSCGDSIRKSARRISATFCGGIAGVILCLICSQEFHLWLIPILIFTAFMAVYKFPTAYASYVFWFSSGLVLLLGLLTGNPAALGWTRFYETFIGCAAGLAASIFIFPLRAAALPGATVLPVLNRIRMLLGNVLENVSLKNDLDALKSAIPAAAAEESFGLRPGESGSIKFLSGLALLITESESLNVKLKELPDNILPEFQRTVNNMKLILMTELNSLISHFETGNAVTADETGLEELRIMARTAQKELFRTHPEQKAEAIPFIRAMYIIWCMARTMDEMAKNCK